MTATVYPIPCPQNTPISGKACVSFQSDSFQDGFAIARINGKVNLVYLLSSSPLRVTAKLFRHEFISIFRLAEIMTLNPADGMLRILEPIDPNRIRYEEEGETVYLEKTLSQKLARMADPMAARRPGVPGLFGPPPRRGF